MIADLRRFLRDDELRLSIGRDARARAAEFTLQRNVSETLKVIEDMAGRK